MYLCMFVRISVYTFSCMQLCMYCMYVCTEKSICIFVCMYFDWVSVYTYVQLCIYFVSVCMYELIYVCMYVCMYVWWLVGWLGQVEVVVQPITRGILRLLLSVKEDFDWADRFHGFAEAFWIW